MVFAVFAAFKKNFIGERRVKFSKATKVMILVGAIIFGIALCQAGINAFLITSDIKSRARAQLGVAAQTTLTKLETALRQSTEDLKILLAHKELENYFTARAFDDTNEMTGSVAVFESFLEKMYKAKPQYTKIQLTGAKGTPFLQVNKGGRVESFDPFPDLTGPAAWQDLLKPAAPDAPGAGVIHKSFFDKQDGWVVLSAAPIRYQGVTEGVLWLYQPVSAFFQQILVELAQGDIACIIGDQNGQLIARSDSIAGRLADDFFRGRLPGWLITQKDFTPLGWTVKVGMQENILYAQQRIFQSIWLLSLFVSLCVAMGALWGLKIYQESLERKIREHEQELVKKNEQLEKAFLSLQQTKDALEKKKGEIETDRQKIQAALNEIFSLITQVSETKTFGVKFVHPALKKCWEIMQCESVLCPCYGKEPERCWQVVGSYSQSPNTNARCYQDGLQCHDCKFYKEVNFDPIFQIGEQFNNMMHILEAQNTELQTAYADLKTSQMQMLQQEKMATVGQLAAGVAHEINNPLGFIISNIKSLKKYVDRILEYVKAQAEYILLSEGKGTPDAEGLAELKSKIKLDYITADIENLLQESLEGAERVRVIVQNLKNFSRVDQSERQSANLNDCVENTIKVIWNELKYKTTITREYGDIPATLCYPQQLSQVFLNLLLNASQAIEKQGEITVKTWAEEENIFISLADTGTGIPQDKINRIFEPFFTTKKVGQGTGLGLSICYEIIVKNHKGKISVHSEEGKGTVFTVQLPIIVGL